MPKENPVTWACGYRDDNLFGDGITDPVAVSIHETKTLGNAGIPQYLLDNYPHAIDSFERHIIEKIAKEPEHMDEFDETIFVKILTRILDGRNFCKWLCPEPDDIATSYIHPFPLTDEEIKQREAELNIICYQIPKDAIVLDFNGHEGALFAWRKP